MTEEGFKRKLTAILSADVEGYSRLMGEDEDATIRTLTAYRELMSTVIQQHRGRVVDSPGDNLLAEFGSVVDAVRCAVEIQEELRVRNAELPETKRMQFRIGINLGDVVQEGERIYGDGVNVTARVEGLAQGGGICISGTVYDSIKNKLSLSYESLGEHTVKNITEPVRVYRMRVGPEVREEKAGPRRWQKAALAAVVVLVVAAGAWAIWNFYFRPPPIEPASVEKMAYPLPDKPSIAVLPFTNISGDPEQEYFSDGLTEEIITALSKTPKMFVVASNSTFTYKGKPVKVNQVAEELGVRYVLEGSVRKSGDRVRITAQLIDALTGHHLWAERYDRDLRDSFAVQDEITLRVLKELQVKLTEGESIRLRSDTKNLEAWICYAKSTTYFQTWRKEDFVKGIKLLERAVELDPEYASAWAMLGILHYSFYSRGWSDTSDEFAAASRKRGIELVDKALEMDEYNIVALTRGAGMYLNERQWDKALAMLEKSIAAAPSDAITLAILAKQKFCFGKFEEAIEYGKESIRLNPFHISGHLWYLARAYNWSGRYKEALEVYERMLKLCENKNCSERYVGGVHMEMVMSYMGLGMGMEARTQIIESLRLYPKGASLEVYRNYFSKRFRDQSHVEKIIDALRRAGVPE